MKVKVKALINFLDMEAGIQREAGKSIWECSEERAEYLLEYNAVEIIEEVKEKAIEVEPEKKLKEEQPKVNIEINLDSKKIAEELLGDPYKDFEVEEKPKKESKKKKTSKK